eukprot:207099-Hanusia_phi.AAC.13
MHVGGRGEMGWRRDRNAVGVGKAFEFRGRRKGGGGGGGEVGMISDTKRGREAVLEQNCPRTVACDVDVVPRKEMVERGCFFWITLHGNSINCSRQENIMQSDRELIDGFKTVC